MTKKSENIDALMESAILIFSRDGFEGASLRDIASHAGVPLSTIHLYFGSKLELYIAVEQKAWNELDGERSVLLRETLDRPENPPTLSRLVHALAYPVVRRALSTAARDIALIFLIRGRVTRTGPDGGNQPLFKVADRSVVRWIDAMAVACPTLTRQDIVWAFSYCISLIYSWQLIDHRYDMLMGQDTARTAEGVTADIVAFSTAGIRALVNRRAFADLDDRP